jgi:hypothetical protein
MKFGMDWSDSEQDKAEIPSTNKASNSIEGFESLNFRILLVLFYDYVQTY